MTFTSLKYGKPSKCPKCNFVGAKVQVDMHIEEEHK